METSISPPAMPTSDHLTTLEVARVLGLAVRSVQLMVDRGALRAWKTPGGHRRIDRASVEAWQNGRHFDRSEPSAPAPLSPALAAPAAMPDMTRVLLIEDSLHYQNLVGLLLRQKFPQVQLRTAGDGIVGLALVGQFQPHVLLVDLLLPGIDGATLISSLRMHEQFRDLRVIVITSLSPEQLAPFAFALQDLPVVHKPQLVAELPLVLAECIAQLQRSARAV
ncbi:MAG: DNA-binding protein [Burkholderiales bacterium PBB4]|nr:MAG: DNA-binding protein [Burkholderiales bacterium PBB4]